MSDNIVGPKLFAISVVWLYVEWCFPSDLTCFFLFQETNAREVVMQALQEFNITEPSR